MQVNAITNFGLNTPQKTQSNSVSKTVNNNLDNSNLNFLGRNEDKKTSGKALRDAAIAMFLLPIASAPFASCDKEDCPSGAHVFAQVDTTSSTTPGYIIDSTSYYHPADTIIKWMCNYKRPEPLDSLFNNLQNWGVEGTDGVDKNDSLANRNIIRYEGVREWEYNNKEVGNMNQLESSKKVLVYDTEVFDYKGRHLSYGKSVIRIPSGNFTVTTKDGRTINSPKGFFVESYTNENNEKGGSIYDCTLQSRAFCQTNGDTLYVAKRQGSSEYVEKGRVSKGYLGANTILLENLIGMYETDDHYTNMKVKAVSDAELKALFIKAKDEEE